MPDQLADNMRLAVAVASETRVKVPKSSNYEDSSSPVKLAGKGVNTATDAEIQALRSATNDLDRALQQRDLPTDQLRRTALTQHAMATIAAKCGNCDELSEVAAYLLLQRGAKNIDRVVVTVSGGTLKNANVLPHVFVVLGRFSTRTQGRGEDIGLPSSWGASAVICDPWDRNVYAASRYKEFWDGLENAKTSGKLVCKLMSHYD